MLNANRLADHAANDHRLTMGEARIEGSAGTLTLNGYAEVHFRAHGSSVNRLQGFNWQDIGFGGDCVYATNRHVVEHLLCGSPLQNEAAHYLVNRRIESAIYRSHREQRWLTLDEFAI